MDFVDHAKPVRLLGGDRFSGHQHLHGLPRREYTRQEDWRAATRGQANHCFGLPKDGLIGGDDEVRADGHLAAAAIGHPIDSGEDRPAQRGAALYRTRSNTWRWRSHSSFVILLALVQIAANREGPVTCPGQDGNSHGGTGRYRLEDLDQLCSQFRCNGIVGMRPVEGDDRHASTGDVLDQYKLSGSGTFAGGR